MSDQEVKDLPEFTAPFGPEIDVVVDNGTLTGRANLLALIAAASGTDGDDGREITGIVGTPSTTPPGSLDLTFSFNVGPDIVVNTGDIRGPSGRNITGISSADGTPAGSLDITFTFDLGPAEVINTGDIRGPAGTLAIPIYKASNSDDTTNINNGGLAFVPIFGNELLNTDPGLFTILNANQLTAEVAMDCIVFWNLSYTSTVQRVSVISELVKDFATEIPRFYNGYLRATNGHNEATSSGFGHLRMAAGETIGIASQAGAVAGTATMIDGQSQITILVLELL